MNVHGARKRERDQNPLKCLFEKFEIEVAKVVRTVYLPSSRSGNNFCNETAAKGEGRKETDSTRPFRSGAKFFKELPDMMSAKFLDF